MENFKEIFNVKEKLKKFEKLFSYSELSLITWHRKNSLVSLLCYFELGNNNTNIIEYFLYENYDEDVFIMLAELEFI